ncbi:MAG TPA: mechanosensitive ion channel domain-containing protein [Desulfatiglandales bacterium]|nr:mechanosensitive ion channel domain-containing protein [Desulfatiglandales bacterium]
MASKELFHSVQGFLDNRLFTIGTTEVTLSAIFVFLFILLVIVIFSRLFARKLVERILVRLQIDEGTRYTFRRIIEYTFILIGAIIAFQSIGINLSGLAVIFGLLSVGIGFGLQNITSNFVAGLILLFERPIKVGDRVTVGDIEGDVVEINIRSTTVRSLNNIDIIVPNSEFVSSQVINWSHGDRKIRLDIEVGVSYQSDLDTVLRSLNEVALENPEILRNPEPDVHLREFGDSSWNMKLRIWIDNPKRHPVVRSDINCAIVRKFRENGVEIPFPQRDLHLRSPLPTPLLVSQGVEHRAV